MPGRHCNDRESRTWICSPDAVTMSPMHRRRRNMSIFITKYLPANHRRNLPITWKYAYDNMETSPKATLADTSTLVSLRKLISERRAAAKKQVNFAPCSKK